MTDEELKAEREAFRAWCLQDSDALEGSPCKAWLATEQMRDCMRAAVASALAAPAGEPLAAPAPGPLKEEGEPTP